MVVSAVRGAVGFLTRLPLAHDDDAWNAFRRTPAAFPLAGYVVGALVALPFAVADVAALPATTVAVAALAWLYAVTGINHLDGVADLGDAAVVHGDAERRLSVLKDSTLGVGGTVALVVVALAAALALFELARLPALVAVAAVVAAEVGAKLSMAGVACLGSAHHEGLGSLFTGAASPAALVPAVVAALPVAAVGWPAPTAAAALAGAVLGGGALAWRANRLVGGVSGDVFGAANEVGRLVGLHAGVIAWTLS